MTPSELLAAFLLADRERARTAELEIQRRELWGNAVRLAATWRSLPLLRRKIPESGAAVPEEARRMLTELSTAAAAESAMVCHRAAKTLEVLESAGVRAAAFKGLGMIASVYFSPSSRMLSDADILFRREDFPQLSRVLGEAGFHPAISISFEAWLELLEERVYPIHDFIDFSDADGVKLDLHWHVRMPSESSTAIDEVFARSSVISIGRNNVRVISKEDLLVFACHHLVRDRFEPRSAVKDLNDIAAIIESRENPIQADVLIAIASRSGLSVSVLAALHILSRYDNRRAAKLEAAIGEKCNDRDRVTSRKLSDVFFLQLRRGVLSDTAIGMTDVTPALAAKFLTSRLKSLRSSSYRQHKFVEPAGEKRSRGLGLLFRDMLTMTPRRFAAYRALARETRSFAEGKRST